MAKVTSAKVKTTAPVTNNKKTTAAAQTKKAATPKKAESKDAEVKVVSQKTTKAKNGGTVKTVQKDDGSTVKTTYNKDGKKTKSVTTKKNGDVATTKYKGGVKTSTTKTTKSGDKTTVKYNEDGKRTSAKKTTADGTVTKTSYNKNGEKTKSVTTNKEGDKTTTKYNTKTGQKTSKVRVDAETGDKTTTKYKYDKNGNLDSKVAKTTRKESDGKTHVVSYAQTNYDDNGKKTGKTVMDAKGNFVSKTAYEYDKDGKLKTTNTEKADGSTKVVNYDPSTGKRANAVVSNAEGLVTKKTSYNINTGVRTSVERYDYDDNGQVSRTRTYGFDANGKHTTRQMYNADGELTRASRYEYNEDGSMNRYDYTPTGEYKGQSRFEYDEHGNLKSDTHTNAKGEMTSRREYTYYRTGVRKSETIVTDELGTIKSAIKYNSNGTIKATRDVTTAEDGSKVTTDAKYENGVKTSETVYDAKNAVDKRISYTNGTDGKPTSGIITNANGDKLGEIKFTYDKNGNRTGKVTTYVDGTTESETFEFDADNNMTKSVITDKNNRTVTTEKTYTEAGTLATKTKTDADGKTVSAAYTHDGLGRMTSKTVTNAKGEVSKKEVTYEKKTGKYDTVTKTNAAGKVTKTEYGYYDSYAKKREDVVDSANAYVHDRTTFTEEGVRTETVKYNQRGILGRTDYDKAGNVTQRAEYDLTQVGANSRYTGGRVYNADGDLIETLEFEYNADQKCESAKHRNVETGYISSIDLYDQKDNNLISGTEYYNTPVIEFDGKYAGDIGFMSHYVNYDYSTGVKLAITYNMDNQIIDGEEVAKKLGLIQ